MYRGCAKQHPNIPKSPRRLLRSKRIWERDWLRKTGVEVRGVGVDGRGRYRECVIGRENQWVPPEQIKAMTSSHGKEQGAGWRGVGSEGRRERREHPQSPILRLGAHPLEWIRAEQWPLNEWDPKSHRRKTNHQWESGRVRERWRKRQRGMERERETLKKMCAQSNKASWDM